MSVFKRFEDIQAWQKARSAANQIYLLTTNSRNDQFARDYGLKDQMRRAAVSVMANIAEGNGRRTNLDFASFVVRAHASAAEVQSHLYVALDIGYISQQEFQSIYQLYEEVSKMTMGLAKYLRESESKPQQTHQTQQTP